MHVSGTPAGPADGLRVTQQVGSTIIAQAAGVPTLPWSGSGVAISFDECDGVIPPDAYDAACIHSLDEALSCCARIGYPVMLKASWGGGGKGIRKVTARSCDAVDPGHTAHVMRSVGQLFGAFGVLLSCALTS